MRNGHYRTAAEAYTNTLAHVWNCPDGTSSPRGFKTRECLDYMFTITEPKMGPIITGCSERDAKTVAYLEKETKLYNSGEVSAEVWATEASTFWRQLANPDGTINSNYGKLIYRDCSQGNSHFDPGYVTPFDWAVLSLLKDRDSRQAQIPFALPQHRWHGNKDQVCTMHMNLRITGNYLHATTVMRSNDLIKGTIYDLPFFISVQHKAVEVLNGMYAQKNQRSVMVGTYTHLAHSLHVYERDADVVKMILASQYKEETDDEK